MTRVPRRQSHALTAGAGESGTCFHGGRRRRARARAQEEGEGEEEEPATPAREALKYDANGAVKKAALRSENEAQRAADLDRRALAPPEDLGQGVRLRHNWGADVADLAARLHRAAARQLCRTAAD